MSEYEMRILNENLEHGHVCIRELCWQPNLSYAVRELIMTVGAAIFSYAQMYNIHMTVRRSRDFDLVVFQFENMLNGMNLELNITEPMLCQVKGDSHFKKYLFEYLKFEFDKHFVK